MKIRFASISMIMFLVSLTMLWIFTLIEALLVGIPTGEERIISALFLVVPAVIGTTFGVLSLQRREPRAWVAIAGILLNGLFAFFNILVLFFSG